jgi:hypothetical protein
VQTEVFDKTAHTWTVLGSAGDLPAPLGGNDHCGTAVGTRIYDIQPAGIGVFDTVSGTWTVLPTPAALSPSYFCQATTLPTGHILVTGPGDGSPDALSERVIDYDPVTDTAVVRSGVTASLAEHVAARVGSQLYVTGGDFAPSTAQAVSLDGSTVTNLASPPEPRDDAVGAAIGSVIYVAGGVGAGENTTPGLLMGVVS